MYDTSGTSNSHHHPIPPISAIDFRRHHSYAIWLYFRFCLNYRDIENLLAERVIQVCYETLIRVGCMIRDEGYDFDIVKAVLSRVHAHQPPFLHISDRYRQTSVHACDNGVWRMAED